MPSKSWHMRCAMVETARKSLQQQHCCCQCVVTCCCVRSTICALGALHTCQARRGPPPQDRRQLGQQTSRHNRPQPVAWMLRWQTRHQSTSLGRLAAAAAACAGVSQTGPALNGPGVRRHWLRPHSTGSRVPIHTHHRRALPLSVFGELLVMVR